MAFGEDPCRVRVNPVAQNFAILPRIVMHRLRQENTCNTGLGNRRIPACARDGSPARLAGWHASHDGCSVVRLPRERRVTPHDFRSWPDASRRGAG